MSEPLFFPVLLLVAVVAPIILTITAGVILWNKR